MRRIILILTFFILIFNSNKVYSGTVIMPSTLTTDTTDFVLLSSSGTTPSISGYTGTLLVSAVASDGNVKITTTSNLLRAAGYCGYSSDASSEPTSCSGSSLTEVGFRGTQDDINTALATLSFKGDGTAGSPAHLFQAARPHREGARLGSRSCCIGRTCVMCGAKHLC